MGEVPATRPYRVEIKIVQYVRANGGYREAALRALEVIRREVEHSGPEDTFPDYPAVGIKVSIDRR